MMGSGQGQVASVQTENPFGDVVLPSLIPTQHRCQWTVLVDEKGDYITDESGRVLTVKER